MEDWAAVKLATAHANEEALEEIAHEEELRNAGTP